MQSGRLKASLTPLTAQETVSQKQQRGGRSEPLSLQPLLVLDACECGETSQTWDLVSACTC
jgi:hypothetical protein